MASPGELIDVVSDVLGVPKAMVVNYDRALAAEGLRTKSGRGTSAAAMTSSDAANILTAVAASSLAKDAANCVKTYGALPARYGEVSIAKDGQDPIRDFNAPAIWNLSGVNLPSLQDLDDQHTFHDALAGFISASIDGSLHKAIAKISFFRKDVPVGPWDINVRVWGTFPQAMIRIHGINFDECHSYSVMPVGQDLDRWEFPHADHGDLKQYREFSAKTILAIGDLLREAPDV